MKIEFLIAWSDNTWTTEIHDVPQHECNDVDAVAWANDVLAPTAPYGQAVLFAVYNYGDSCDTIEDDE